MPTKPAEHKPTPISADDTLRAAVLRHCRTAKQPLTLDQLSKATGQPAQKVKAQADLLAKAGQIKAEGAGFNSVP